MRVAIIGSGAREHALAWHISNSKRCTALYCLPGNAGTATLGHNTRLDGMDFQALGRFCKELSIDLLVVGPEAPLVAGVVDYLQTAAPNTNVIGPNKQAAQLEGSKQFAKRFMNRYGIPTPKACVFDQKDYAAAQAYIQSQSAPYVIKANGLAAGKGVFVCDDKQEAQLALDELFKKNTFGAAGHRILIEQHVLGSEVSCFALCDGTNYVRWGDAKDYKKIGEGNTGLNTGGMGAVSPAGLSAVAEKNIEEQVIQRTFEGLKAAGIHYQGILFFGIMLQGNKPYLLEYNVRLGDPEAQVLLPRVMGDILDVFNSLTKGTLTRSVFCNAQTAAVTVAAAGYPLAYEKGFELTNVGGIEADSWVFHAGTQQNKNALQSNGGRILSVVARNDQLTEALKQCYSIVEAIEPKNKLYYREDIGT